MTRRARAPETPPADTGAARADMLDADAVGRYWSERLRDMAASPQGCWLQVPAVVRALARRAGADDPAQHWALRVLARHFTGRLPVAAMLSIGCGTGGLERLLARADAFRSCEGWDVAGDAIAAATAQAAAEGLHSITYRRQDVTAAAPVAEAFDAVWFDSSLHHIAELERVCEWVRRALRHDGRLVLNEYVGPAAFAFPRRQRELMRAAFALLPERLRRTTDGHVLSAPAVPDAAAVRAADPSEAVRSDELLAVVEEHFEIVERVELGGALLQFTLNGIAHNFDDGDADAQRGIELLVAVEDALLALGELESDFVVAVGVPRATRRRRAPRPRSAADGGAPVGLDADAEIGRLRAHLVDVEGYAKKLEGELARRQGHSESLSGYISRLEHRLAALLPARAPETDPGGAAGPLAAERAERERMAIYQRHLEAELGGKDLFLRDLEGYARRLEADLAARTSPPATVETGTRPRVYAVVVHATGAERLQRCLQELAASEGIVLQTLVVLNGGDSPALAALPERHLLPLERPVGFATANNHAVRWAREQLGSPDHWLFLNDDAVVEPRTILGLCRALAAEPRLGIVGPRIVLWGAADRLNSLGLNLTATAEAWDEGIGEHDWTADGETESRRVVAVTGSALLVRELVLRELGGWSESYDYYFEDLDLCLRAQGAGWPVAVVPGALAAHAVSATSGGREEFKRYHSWRNRWLLLARHWPAGRLAALTPRLAARELAIFLQRLRGGHRRDALLQARAWLGAARRLPGVVLARVAHRAPRREWMHLLRAAGSVPPIALPSVPAGSEPWQRLDGAGEGPA